MTNFYRRLLYLFIILLFANSTAALAQTVMVQSLDNVSTVNPPKFLTVKLLSDVQLDENLVVKCGTIITGRIIDVEDPKRLKRDADFSFRPISIEDTEGNYTVISDYYVGEYTTKLEPVKVAKTAALSLGNCFVKGFSLGYNALESAIVDEENDRLKSTAIGLYKKSPVSYVEKGNDILINKGEIFYLKFNGNKKGYE